MKVLAIAAVTLREALRRKVQVNLLLFGLFMVAASYAISTLTLGEMHRVISDIGLSSMTAVGSLLAAFLGSGSIAGDLERRTVHSIAAKPVARAEYVIGRYAGLSVALILNLAVMATALGTILALDARSASVLDVPFFAAVALLGVQLLIVAAVAILFSALTSTTLAAIFTLAVTVAGQLSNDMLNLWRTGGVWVAKLVWYALPNLGALNLNEAVIYHDAIPPAVWFRGLYGLLYAAASVALACLLFERRDFR